MKNLLTTKQLFHIYYLPNAYRVYHNKHTGEMLIVKGKVGFSGMDIEKRRGNNKADGLDITGHCVLIDNITSKSKAMELEKRYQRILRCEEPFGFSNIGMTRSNEFRTKVSIANIGKKLSTETREKISAAQKGKPRNPTSDEIKAKISASKKGIPKIKTPCIHCGQFFDSGNLAKWHNDNCKHKS
jgi:hypothetical protein